MNTPSFPLRLLLLGADPSRAPVCLSVDSSGQIRARRVCDAADPLPAEPGARDILVVPADALRLLWLDLPAHSAAQTSERVAIRRLDLADV